MNVTRLENDTKWYVSNAAQSDAETAVARVARILECIDVGPLDGVMRAEVGPHVGVNGRLDAVRWHLRLFDDQANRSHAAACMIPAIEIFDARHLVARVMVCTKSAFVRLVMGACWNVRPCAEPSSAV